MVFPAEWDMHKATWLAWPDLAEEWRENHEGARTEFLALCRVIAMSGNNPQEKLKILIRSEDERRRVELELKEFQPTFYHFDYGDIWLRDTACAFSKNEKKENVAQVFRFNGWGGKYLLRKDAELAEEVAKKAGVEMVRHSFVLEGGAIDHNGSGLWVTTEDCLLNPNRNTRMNKADYENHFKKLGAKKVCWIKDGLLNDHTDGHVDNILRFVNEDTLVCMTSAGKADPQGERIEEIHEQVKEISSELGLNLVTIQGPGEVESPDGDFMPASYMNFYIANNSVAVPLYGSPQDEAAVEIIQGLFPTRKVVGLSSRNILTGGGSFHCITQQEPQ
jgi:agmatine deiminase